MSLIELLPNPGDIQVFEQIPNAPEHDRIMAENHLRTITFRELGYVPIYNTSVVAMFDTEYRLWVYDNKSYSWNDWPENDDDDDVTNAFDNKFKYEANCAIQGGYPFYFSKEEDQMDTVTVHVLKIFCYPNTRVIQIANDQQELIFT